MISWIIFQQYAEKFQERLESLAILRTLGGKQGELVDCLKMTLFPLESNMLELNNQAMGSVPQSFRPGPPRPPRLRSAGGHLGDGLRLRGAEVSRVLRRRGVALIQLGMFRELPPKRGPHFSAGGQIPRNL